MRFSPISTTAMGPFCSESVSSTLLVEYMTMRRGAKLITEDDIKTAIEHAKCMWETPELISQLYWTNDQDEDDTVRRHLNRVPFEANLIRNMRLTIKQFC